MSKIVNKQIKTFKSVQPPKPKNVKNKEKKNVLHEKLKELKFQLSHLEDELDNEKKKRNKLQLERDKMQQFWDIAKDQNNSLKHETLQQAVNAEDFNDNLRKDISNLNDKIAFLLRDQERESRLHEEEIMERDKHWADQLELVADKDVQNIQVWETIEEQQKNLLLEKEQFITKLKEEHEKVIRLTMEAYKKEKESLKNELIKEHQHEMRRLKLEKFQQFDELLKHHEVQICDLQANFDESIEKKKEELENLQIINKQLNTKCHHTEMNLNKELDKVTRLENQVDILNKTIEKFASDLKKLELYKRDSDMYRKELKQAKLLGHEYREKYEILYQTSKKIENERDQLYANFQQAVEQIQQQASVHRDMLNQQINKVEKFVHNSAAEQDGASPTMYGLEKL